MIILRQKLLAAYDAMTKPSASKVAIWDDILLFTESDIPQNMTLFAKLEVTLEWQTAGREATYQKSVVALLSDLESVILGPWTSLSFVPRLSCLLRRADSLNLQQLKAIRSMKIFLVHILATKAQFQIAKDNHDLLVSTKRRVGADFEMKTSVACLTVPTFSTLAKDLEAGDEESEEEDEDDHTQQDTHY